MMWLVADRGEVDNKKFLLLLLLLMPPLMVGQANNSPSSRDGIIGSDGGGYFVGAHGPDKPGSRNSNDVVARFLHGSGFGGQTNSCVELLLLLLMQDRTIYINFAKTEIVLKMDCQTAALVMSFEI